MVRVMSLCHPPGAEGEQAKQNILMTIRVGAGENSFCLMDESDLTCSNNCAHHSIFLNEIIKQRNLEYPFDGICHFI